MTFCAAISQRNVLEPPDGLQSQEDELREMLLEFFEEHLQERFPEADYTFDVYITTAGKVPILSARNLFLPPPCTVASLPAIPRRHCRTFSVSSASAKPMCMHDIYII